MGTAAEQLTARISRVATGNTPQQKSQWLQNQFSKWSVTRGDQGRLSLQQFKSALKSLNVKDEGGAEQVFTSLDSQGRNSVPVAELAAALTAAPPPAPAPAPPQQRRGGGRYPTEQHATSVAPLATWPREEAVPRTPTGPRTEGLGADGTPVGRHVPMSQLVTRPDVWAVAEQKANQYESMRKAFQWMDVNHSGQLSLEEMENACRLWNLPDPPAAAMAVFDSIDKNHDGKVSYNEFVNALSRNRTMDRTADKPAQAQAAPQQFHHTMAPLRPMELPQADAKCVDIASGPNRTRGTPHGKRHLDLNRPPSSAGGPPLRADPPSPAVAFPPRSAAPTAATMPPTRPGPTASSPSEARPTQPPPLPPPSGSHLHVDISDAIICRFRDCILARGGPHGIHELGRSFLIMDSDRNHLLSSEELDNGLSRYGLHMSPKDLQMLMLALDKEDAGTLSFDEFLLGVRGEISPGRQALIEMVFRVFDRTGDGVVTLQDLQNNYDVNNHPDVISGRMTQDEALGHFLDQFDLREHDHVITLGEFTEYYKNVSASIDDDEYFEVLIRKAWGLPPANGATQ